MSDTAAALDALRAAQAAEHSAFASDTSTTAEQIAAYFATNDAIRAAHAVGATTEEIVAIAGGPAWFIGSIIRAGLKTQENR